SPVEGRPGLLIRDSYGYSDATLIIPPVLVECLGCFDGQQTALDLRAVLVRVTWELDVSQLEEHLKDTLNRAGFLENEAYEQMKLQRQREFAEAPVRLPAHAGSGYPGEAGELSETLSEYMQGGPPASAERLIGIAAPHVSPFGGWECYRDAYSALTPDYRDRTFVVLGTSHYGEPDRFGLTRKNFITPFGEAATDLALVDRLAIQPAALMEDYCHSVEHSIEFQILFLQHLFGPKVRTLPILCGSFARSIAAGTLPEDNDEVKRFLGELAEIAAAREDLIWVLGIDMAHMGRRYGDPFTATVETGEMLAAGARDKDRIARINAADPDGFWDLVRENHDDLKWCGSAPAYTFLKAVPGSRGTLRRYQQWNIDDQSVVSFGALAFSA
ncbi:MAG TPA: AmmeMemoRadiSam system protein B, partial [Bryobacteraceae bacterium]|nr:AmmeMemoRadiSam system protein B [Bryobacteraceae bacterium]